jgi:uncharacterized protein (TIGR02996 family)
MNLEEAFLDDIVAHPHDPTPWLVFADWLEERDDPRGELVRLLRLCWDEPRKKAFKTRHARLQELFASGVRLPLPHFTNSLGVEFVWVPPGTFWLGGDNGKPGKRQVEMTAPFWMGIHLVTQGQWQTLMGSNPSTFGPSGTSADRVREIGEEGLAHFPVERVSWHDTQEFVAALNAREREAGWAYRLPSDEEWEYACRGPVTCRADCAFSFHAGEPSNSLSSHRANFDGRHSVHSRSPETGPYVSHPTRVGSYPANRLGIFDLHGNVEEWTDTPEGSNMVVRGGDWYDHSPACRAARRSGYPLDYRYCTMGFRLARVWSGR